MDEQGDQRDLVEALHRFSRVTEKLLSHSNTNTTNVRLEGSGQMWGALSVGIALGSAIVCAMWVGATLGDLTDDQRNDDAFIQATYQQAPSIRAEFDRMKAEQESKK